VGGAAEPAAGPRAGEAGPAVDPPTAQTAQDDPPSRTPHGRSPCGTGHLTACPSTRRDGPDDVESTACGDTDDDTGPAVDNLRALSATPDFFFDASEGAHHPHPADLGSSPSDDDSESDIGGATRLEEYHDATEGVYSGGGSGESGRTSTASSAGVVGGWMMDDLSVRRRVAHHSTSIAGGLATPPRRRGSKDPTRTFHTPTGPGRLPGTPPRWARSMRRVISEGRLAATPAFGTPQSARTTGRRRKVKTSVVIQRQADGAEEDAVEVTIDKKVRRIPLVSIVGIRFDIFYEGQMKKSYGQVLLVRRSDGLMLEQWKSWIWLIVHTFVLWLVTSQLIGPVAALAVIAALGPAVYKEAASWSEAASPLGSPPLMGRLTECAMGSGTDSGVDGATIPARRARMKLAEGQLLAEAPDPIRVVSLASICGFLWIVCTWIVPRLARRAGGDTVAQVAMTLACVAAIALVRDRHDALVERFGINIVEAMPALRKPDCIQFKQHEIGVMLEAREAIMNLPNDPQFYRRMRNLSVGSFWVETVLSSLMPRQIYNSIPFRRGLYFFLNFVMPVLFALQVFGVIRPHLSNFKIVLVTSLQQDWLLRAVHWVVDRHLYTGDFLYLKAIVNTCVYWTSTVLNHVAEVVQAAEYARLKLKRLGESTQVLSLLGQAVWDVFAQLGGVLVQLASLATTVITSTPLKYCMTVINGMLKTDRFAHVLSANQRFWRYVNNVRRFLGMPINEAAAGEAPLEDHLSEEEGDDNDEAPLLDYPSDGEMRGDGTAFGLHDVALPDFDLELAPFDIDVVEFPESDDGAASVQLAEATATPREA